MGILDDLKGKSEELAKKVEEKGKELLKDGKELVHEGKEKLGAEAATLSHELREAGEKAVHMVEEAKDKVSAKLGGLFKKDESGSPPKA
jgi:ribosome-binding protein aMBF1 (putative translation factor)